MTDRARDLDRVIDGAFAVDRPIVFLTGAGISAESGIPTFRGKDGFWTVGSAVYRPEEVATAAFFEKSPADQWPWYLWRRAACRAARPNAAHEALVRLEDKLGDGFMLITQNVDGLHRAAGQSAGRTIEIHGNIHRMRCARPCTPATTAMPDAFLEWTRERALSPADLEALHCRSCGAWMRPHVLWFDECYNEEWFCADSALSFARSAGVLVVVGTMGATNLPQQIGQIAVARGTPVIDINPEPNVFRRFADATGGVSIDGTATAEVPPLVERILARRAAQ